RRGQGRPGRVPRDPPALRPRHHREPGRDRHAHPAHRALLRGPADPAQLPHHLRERAGVSRAPVHTPTASGAQALLGSLLDGGVDTCSANPGTSEMHFVAALDGVARMRAVLTLFEGVATGAADGYARMAERPAATLLHLGPGLANGLANLHNARRAGTGVVNVVGDHATTHAPLDAPLQSDIHAIAGAVSGWVRTTTSPAEVGADAAEAVAAAKAG